MITQQDVINVYTENRDMLLAMANKRMLSKRTNNLTIKSPLMVDEIYAEEIVDNLLFDTLKGRRFKLGFESSQHVLNYLVRGLKKNIKCFYRRRYIELMEPLTDEEREENFELARNIINKNRGYAG